MKQIVLLLTMWVLLFISSCWQEDQSQSNQTSQFNPELVESKAIVQSLETVSADAFETAINTWEYSVLDLRTTAELKQSGIIGEQITQIDVYEDPKYLEKLQALDPDEKYAIYCRSWWRTGSMMTMMEQLWFKNVVELKGGIWNWSREWKTFIDFDESKLLSLNFWE